MTHYDTTSGWKKPVGVQMVNGYPALVRVAHGLLTVKIVGHAKNQTKTS
jgi:hypothetical protein